MGKESINKRFLEAVQALIDRPPGLTKSAIADSLGIKPSKFTEILKERMMAGTDALSLIVEKYGVSADWLLRGEGEMFVTQTDGTENLENKNIFSKKLIPLYDDASTIGGYNDTVADVNTPSGRVAEWIDAGDWFPEATSAIRHYGDSMVEYPSGSILALKRVQDLRLILNGRSYVIETSEFRVTKQLQYHAGDDFIMAYSSNRETYPDGTQIHSPITIPLESVRSIDLVLGCVLKEYSNGAIPIIKR